MYNYKSLGQHISIKLGMEVEADMRDRKMVINKEKVILGTIMTVALFSVGIGLASVLSDSKNYENNKNNVVDLNESNASDEVADSELDKYILSSDSLTGVDDGKAVNNDNGGMAGRTEEETTTVEQEGMHNDDEKEVAAGVAIDPMSAYSFNKSSVLMWPIAGNIVMNYSMDSTILHKTLGTYKTNPAISISATIGTNVGAAASGIVQSIYESEETGTTMIIAVGDGYTTTYGLLDNLTVKEGDAVIAGQVLGTVGAPTAYYVEEGPNVYFAVNKDGEPVDPTEYLVTE